MYFLALISPFLVNIGPYTEKTFLSYPFKNWATELRICHNFSRGYNSMRILTKSSFHKDVQNRN